MHRMPNPPQRPLATAALGCLLATGAVRGQTLDIEGETKHTVGVLREAVSGDASCYLQLESDSGEIFHESAAFELCEDASLIGQRLKLSYSVENVLAESCQGDVDCGKSDRVVLVTSARVLGPAAAAAAASLCAPDESIAFDCATGTKRVSVCASADASNVSGSLQYRFGKADGSAPPERVVPDHTAVPRLASRGESTPFAGGGGSWLRFHDGAYAYVVYSGVGRWGAAGETLELQGVQVERDGQIIATLPCTGPLRSALGPDWFERMGVIAEGEEFYFPSEQ